ncbi:hypothetical protein BASA61_000416 [Batrachochytrium salamandrivorans]|nr:hypothetical protein BASA60_000438 [Batrachochytrium salamandrivorans]KAH6578885.1 hypothetical protein BASA61_000416 [Batrachochytrium salamandrivorans]
MLSSLSNSTPSFTNKSTIAMTSKGNDSVVVVSQNSSAADNGNSESTHKTPKKSIFSRASKGDPDDKKSVGPKLSYFKLYRHATGMDMFLIFMGTICGLVNGATLPYMTIVFGSIMDHFVMYDGSPASRASLDSGTTQGVIQLCVLGVVTFVTSYGQMCFWMLAGENQAKRIRELYFKAILRQEVAWFDETSTGELTTRMNADTSLIQEGLSDKVGLMIQFTSSFVAGFIIGFVKGWKLSLVLTTVFPVLAGAVFMLSDVLAGRSTDQQSAYASAGNVAQQVLSSMRTVASFGSEEREVQRYSKHLAEAEVFGLRMALYNGVGVGFVQGVIFLVYALAFWYGNTLVPATMTPGDVLNVFFAIIIGAFSLGNATPHISAIGTAQGAAFKIFETIDRMSPIDPSSTTGAKPETVKGHITFNDIEFHYPTRVDVPILKNFSLTVKEGNTVALVGASGSGKSTIAKLVERFYDPVSGSVSLDGRNIKELNVTWLRQQIGMVSQEPTLFDCSIRQNLIYGLRDDGASIPAEKLNLMIEDACKMANAWEFIQKLPNGIDTNVGEAGSMLSGGQKQRIAIARAIIKDPRILLLDEATSALDTESERIVQAALERASQNRTTIVIAHRLSTIKNADVIVVMSKGVIAETGTHDSLIAQQGIYYSLVQTQTLRSKEAGDGSAADISSGALSTESLSLDKIEDVAASKSHDATDAKSMARRPSVKAQSVALAEEKEKTKLALNRKVNVMRILWLNRPEWGLFVIGGLGAILNGVVMPVFSIVFSVVLTSLGTDRANFWSLMFVVLGVVAFISNFCQIGLFKYAGQKLTRRLREMTFRALLRQEIAFFDVDENSTGALTAKLAEDANLVQGVTGPTFGAVIQAFASIVSGMIIAFSSSWQLSLVILGLVPLIGFAGYFQMQALVGYGQKSREAYESAGQTATEAISSVRTVLLLTQEPTFYNRFLEQIKTPHRMAVRGSVIAAFGYALSQAILYWAWCVSFYYGSRLIMWGLYDPQAILKVIFAIIFTSMSAGQVSQHTPDAAKAKLAALAICDILDRQSKIDPGALNGEKRDTTMGHALTKEVTFSYPSRPNNKVLTGLTVEALPGTTVAFVGRSGCGKSTVLGLLERWYDVDGGSALYDDLDVREWNLKHLRSQMALVGQEPILFNMSIKDNIGYGAINEFTDSNIIDAAKLANIHDFISALPKGYDTPVGEKGGLLSGGQKQRIAIARALIRNPRLLLLDEATSALDSESEKVVQTALDAASKGRTTLVIAHRLSTIQDADKIFVVNGGKIVESGTHFELVDKRGEYYELVSQQMLSVDNL